MKKILFVLVAALPLCLTAESTEDYFERSDDEGVISEGPYRPPLYGPHLFDLQELSKPFVLQTKRIEIPGFPDVFNPSLIDWNGELLLSFRIYGPKGSTHQIGLVRLDRECNLAGPAQILEFAAEDRYCHQKRQDPRLITVAGRLYIVYNNHLKTVVDREIRRMLVAEVLERNGRFVVEKSDIFLHFEGEEITRTEKNWVPFEYEGELLWAYSINPHRILRPILGTEMCASVCSSSIALSWDWGALRGGTQALRMGDEYLAFFHSSKNLPTLHSNGKTMLHYFMGAYTFSAHPPFQITRISPEPIIGPEFYTGPAYKTWKPLRVVFPCGFVVVGDALWISYGKQDHEVWVAKLDRTQLLNSLIPVSPP
jgi:predicted GH43/DUF377 family glycosyl hydrolase